MSQKMENLYWTINEKTTFTFSALVYRKVHGRQKVRKKWEWKCEKFKNTTSRLRTYGLSMDGDEPEEHTYLPYWKKSLKGKNK